MAYSLGFLGPLELMPRPGAQMEPQVRAEHQAGGWTAVLKRGRRGALQGSEWGLQCGGTQELDLKCPKGFQPLPY